jgi:hypothetical protein
MFPNGSNNQCINYQFTYVVLDNDYLENELSWLPDIHYKQQIAIVYCKFVESVEMYFFFIYITGRDFIVGLVLTKYTETCCETHPLLNTGLFCPL